MQRKLFYQLASFLLALSIVITGPAAFALMGYDTYGEDIVSSLDPAPPEDGAPSDDASETGESEEEPGDNEESESPSGEGSDENEQDSTEAEPSPEEPGSEEETEPVLPLADELPLFQPAAGSLNAVYLNGTNTGKDTNDGLSASTPVKTFSTAKELLAPDGVIYISGTVTLAADEEWTLAGYGDARVERAPDFTGVLIQTGKYELKLSDITIDGGGDSVPGVMGALIHVNNKDGSLIIEDGTILQNNHTNENGGAICIDKAATVSISGENTHIRNNSSSKVKSNNASPTEGGGAIHVTAKANITISDGAKITGNSAVAYGGAILMSNGDLKITSGTVLSNNRVTSSDSLGGAIYAKGTGNNFPSITIVDAGTTFSENWSAFDGGAIHATCDLTIKDGVIFDNNSSDNFGGAIYYSGANKSLTISDSNTLFTRNNATSGGAIYIYNVKSGSLSDAQFISNVASKNGGAIVIGEQYSSSTTYSFPVSGITLSGNRASIAYSDIPSLSTNSVSAAAVTEGFESPLNNYDVWHYNVRPTTSKPRTTGHLVTYHMNDEDGSIYETIFCEIDKNTSECVLDENAHNAVLPIRSGHRFLGWYKDADCTIPYTYTSEWLTTYLDLYAKWEILPESVDVTFNYNYSGAPDGGVYTVRSTAPGDVVSAPEAAPTREGYRFTGWYTEAACNNLHNFESDVFWNDTTLYAGWIKTYTITYYLGYLTGIEGVYQRDIYDAGASVTEPEELERAGYTFTGWYENASLIDLDSLSVTRDMELTAGWKLDNSGKTIYLSGSGSDDNNGFTPETPVKTFDKAAELVDADGIIYICGAVTFTSGETQFPQNPDKNFILMRHPDYNGSLISLSEQGTKLTLENVIIDGNMDSINKQVGTAALISVTKGAELTVSSGTILRNNYCAMLNHAGAIYVTGSDAVKSVVTITNGAIIENNQYYSDKNEGSGGVYVFKSQLNVTNGAILRNNTTSLNGGAIFAKSGSVVVIKDGTINDNKALRHIQNGIGTNGGAIHMEGSVLEISGNSEISGNITDPALDSPSKSSGGGISIVGSSDPHPSKTTITSGVQITNNKAEHGGGICCMSGTLDISDGVVVSNNIATNGGGLYTNSSSVLIENAGTEFSQNEAELGGGIYVRGSKSFKVTDGAAILGNSASRFGGGIFVYDSEVDISGENTTVSQNTALQRGGGVYLEQYETYYGTLLLHESASIDHNTAGSTGGTGDGGGMYIRSGTYAYLLSGASIDHNTAYNNGGGIYNEVNAHGTVREASASYNSAWNNGGAAYSEGSLVLREGVSLFGNTAGTTFFDTTYNAAFWNNAESHLASNDHTVHPNDGTGNGGGIYIQDGHLYIMEGAAFEGNLADFGGGVFINTGTDFALITGSKLDAATLDALNRAVVPPSEDPQLDEYPASVFHNNLAHYDGGGIFTHRLDILLVNTVSFTDNLATEKVDDLDDRVALLHELNVINTEYSGDYDFAYNNLDINYQYTNANDLPFIAGVIYYMNDGTTAVHYRDIRLDSNDSTVEENHKPEDPEREDYDFTGWALNEAGTQDFSYPITLENNKIIKVYAQWSKDTGETPGGGGSGGGSGSPLTVTFHWNDGREDDIYHQTTVRRNALVAQPDDPAREGFTFGGWYYKPECTQRYDFDTRVTRNLDLYARWSAELTLDFAPGHYAYLVGYPNGTIRPEAQITRAEIATIFFRMISDNYREEIWSQQNAYSDVILNHWHNNAVSTMSGDGVFRGYPDGSFRPDASITRAELAATVARFTSASYTGENLFTDIDGHWAKDEINRAASFGWITGDGDGTFRPDDYITRAEAATLVNRVLGRLPQHTSDLLDEMIVWPDNRNTDAWFYLAMQEATNSHLHTLKADGIHETWITFVEPRDWTLLEKPDSSPQNIK